MSRGQRIEVALDPRTSYGYVAVLFESGPRRTIERLLIDTGAATTTLDLRLAADVGVDPTALQRERYQTAGSTVESWLWTPDRVEIAGLGIVVEHPRIRFSRNLPVAGLLGNDLLGAVGLVLVVNYPRRVARLIRPG